MSKVIKINEREFDDKIKNGKVLVDCYAVWCGPCQMLSPIIDELSDEIDSINFYKLNIDESVEVATKYRIMSIPTILLFENGELKKTLVGFKSKEELEQELNS